jgi:hypothetical protein
MILKDIRFNVVFPAYTLYICSFSVSFSGVEVLNSYGKLFSGIFLVYFLYYPVNTTSRDSLGFMLNH